MYLLEIDSVNFSYGTNKILSDIYLKVGKGEVVGFLGRNGCGKSTLLKVIFGVLKGENQSVRISGTYLREPFKSGRLKFSPQEGLFPGFLTPAKAIRLYESQYEELLQYDEVKDNLHMSFRKMSGGISKFIETLIILYSPCQFVLLDEPFSFISPVLVEKLIPVIRSVAAEKGILLTDHQYESILKVSDRIYLLRNQSLFTVTGRRQLQDMGYIN